MLYMCRLLDMFFNKRNKKVGQPASDTDVTLNEFIDSNDAIIIERFCYAPNGTFGRLYYDDFSCFTVEREWANNMPYISCIPDGRYICNWHNSPRFGNTLAVVGGSVSLSPSPTHQRSAILFHLGNWPTNFNGCIGLGHTFACINGEMGVSSSRDTVQQFLSLFHGKANIPLIITNITGAISETT